jgi:hypothetical protein
MSIEEQIKNHLLIIYAFTNTCIMLYLIYFFDGFFEIFLHFSSMKSSLCLINSAWYDISCHAIIHFFPSILKQTRAISIQSVGGEPLMNQNFDEVKETKGCVIVIVRGPISAT